jgi:integrase
LDNDAPKRKGMSGPCRALAYMTAMASGLRANELRSLTWESFNLETGTIRVQAKDAKNRKRTIQTIPSWLAEKLSAWKDSGGMLWQGFPQGYPGRLLKADLLAARSQWIDQASDQQERKDRERSTVCQYQIDGPDGPLFLDFHSLRHWYVTELAGLEGISPSTLQSLVRHSDPRLTMKVYAKAKTDQVRSTVDRIRMPEKK